MKINTQNIAILLLFLFVTTFSLQAQQTHVVKKLTKVNSSRQSDFGATFYGDSSVVFASSRKWKGESTKIWPGNNEPYLDLYIGTIRKDFDIDNIRKFGGSDINTKYHESNIVFTKDNTTAYFTRNNFLYNDFQKDSTGYNLIQMYKAVKGVNDDWADAKIEAMPFNDDNYQTGHPALNAAENKLYFASDMPGSYGETDIFVVDINSDGSYGEPKNLGPNVNTYAKEMFPYVDENDFLYFSSDGFSGGEGKLDIYITKLEEGKPVGLAMNVGAPINSREDDFALAIQPGKDYGYFSSNRRSKDSDDIYSFKFYSGFMNNVTHSDAGICANAYEGVVKEEGTQALLPGALVKLYNKKGKLLESVRSNDFGKYVFRLPCGDEEYKLTASKNYYGNDTANFVNVPQRMKNGVDLEQLEVNLTLKPEDFVAGTPGGGYGLGNGLGNGSGNGLGNYLMIDNINPIYFDLDKSNIRQDAAIEIEKVIRIMKRYPKLEIEVSSFTDSRADDAYNLALSERRAKSTRDWLIRRGIDANRISAKGYGETLLVNRCANGVKCSESEHQLNRRTEFVVKNPSIIREEEKK